MIYFNKIFEIIFWSFIGSSLTILLIRYNIDYDVISNKVLLLDFTGLCLSFLIYVILNTD